MGECERVEAWRNGERDFVVAGWVKTEGVALSRKGKEEGRVGLSRSFRGVESAMAATVDSSGRACDIVNVVGE
jgi:hypothetical protein